MLQRESGRAEIPYSGSTDSNACYLQAEFGNSAGTAEKQITCRSGGDDLQHILPEFYVFGSKVRARAIETPSPAQ
jgi:hypothetical protein